MERDNAKLKYVSFKWYRVTPFFFCIWEGVVLEFRKVWVQILTDGGAGSKTQLTNGEGILGI